MPIYAGVSGANRQVMKVPVGVSGANRDCRSAWAGAGSANRQIFMAGTPLSSKAIGDIVKIKENGVQTNFLVLSHGYPASGRTLLLRESLYDSRAWNGVSTNAYATSDIDSWLNGDYLNFIDASIRAQITAINISYTVGNRSNTVTTLSRKVFLLSYTEVGFSGSSYTNVEGSPLSYFNSASRRIGYLNGAATGWWLRSPHTGTIGRAWYVRNDGGPAGGRNVTDSYGWRPAFSLPSSILLNDNNEIIGS